MEDAFGARDESLVRTIPKSEFPPGVKVGGQLQGVGNDGQPAVFNVVKIKGPEVHLDGNHPGGPGAEVQLQRSPPCGQPPLKKLPTAMCMARTATSIDARVHG